MRQGDCGEGWEGNVAANVMPDTEITGSSAHNLRHTACSNMVRQGMNRKILQYLMGHAQSDVTMDLYDHIANKQYIKEEVERYARVAGN